jgi:chemotaxis protein CheX
MVDKAKRLEEVITTMFATVLHMDIWRNPAAMVASQGQPHISASVQVSGAWIGIVVLTIPTTLAETLSASMFEIDEDELTTEDVEDAMGELANIAGGSFKSSMEGHCKLGLPVVASGLNYCVRFPGSVEIAKFGFECEDECFHATIIEKEDQ